MKVRRVFSAAETELHCITLTDFSLQPLKAEAGFDLRPVHVILVVDRGKFAQGFFPVLPFLFQYRFINTSYSFPCCCRQNKKWEKSGSSYFWLRPRCWKVLRSSGVLRSSEWQFCTGVSRQGIGPILNLQDGTDTVQFPYLDTWKVFKECGRVG
jgi:hypothetical protein